MAAGEPAYTDVDYRVYTAGARAVARGGSPFEEPGTPTSFRYSPFVAFAVLPNLWVHPAAGKVLFCACDLLIAWLLVALERSRSVILHWLHDATQVLQLPASRHVELLQEHVFAIHRYT